MRKSIWIMSIIALALIMAGPLSAFAKAGQPKPQEFCPVMGGKINKNIYADHDGKRVYFCCKGCIGTFKKDPEHYIKTMEDRGITLGKAPKPQTTCPVMGGEINKEIHTDYKGKRIYFCCEPCVDMFLKVPEKYSKKLESEGFVFEKTPETKSEKEGDKNR